MKQTFYLDGEHRTFQVVKQASKATDNGSIQISKVIDLDNANLLTIEGETAILTAPAHYIYEEIDASDCVTYARFMGLDNIGRCHAWALA
jgi:hypothetical protein